MNEHDCVVLARSIPELGLEEGDVMFMGVGSYCEIWKADTFAATQARSVEDWLSAAGDGFDPISLLGPLGGG